MVEPVAPFTVTFEATGDSITVRVNPPNEVLEMFLSTEIRTERMREDLVRRALEAKSGRRANYGSDAYGIHFDSEGVELEHNYLQGEPSVTVGLDNFLEIVSRYPSARQMPVDGCGRNGAS